MPNEIKLPTHGDARGNLTVIDSILPFPILRVYYIYGCSLSPRGGHRHIKTKQALVCLAGSCIIDWDDGLDQGSVCLDSPDKLLVLEPEDWHIMRDFSENAVLLALASEHYDASDYIDERYER